MKNKIGLNACGFQEEDEVMPHFVRPIKSFLVTFFFVTETNTGKRQFAVDLKRHKILLVKFFQERKKNFSAR